MSRKNSSRTSSMMSFGLLLDAEQKKSALQLFLRGIQRRSAAFNKTQPIVRILQSYSRSEKGGPLPYPPSRRSHKSVKRNTATEHCSGAAAVVASSDLERKQRRPRGKKMEGGDETQSYNNVISLANHIDPRAFLTTRDLAIP